MSARRAGACKPPACGLRLIVVAVAVIAAGCAGGGGAPGTLADGSPTRVAGIRFETVDGPVLRTRTVRADLAAARASSRTASCLNSGWSSPAMAPVVRRVSASGESVTFQGESGHSLRACDGEGVRAASMAWCSYAFGRLTSGRLRDPRLDFGGCKTSDGDPIAFAWIQPLPEARYVVVRRSGFSEAYETGDGIPVRVAVTERIDIARSRATFDVSEHTATGRLLRRQELEAVVSG